jgi:hypothetical protein
VILVLLLYFLFIIPTIFSFSSYFSCSFTLFHSILSSSLSIYVYVSFVYFSPPFFVHHFLLLDHILFTINLIFNPPPPPPPPPPPAVSPSSWHPSHLIWSLVPQSVLYFILPVIPLERINPMLFFFLSLRTFSFVPLLHSLPDFLYFL